MSGLVAHTEAGLLVWQVDGGLAIEGRIAPLHLGVDLHVGFFHLDRATARQPATGAVAGIRPYLAIDLVDFGEERGFLFVAAKIETAALYDASWWGPTFSVGARF